MHEGNGLSSNMSEGKEMLTLDSRAPLRGTQSYVLLEYFGGRLRDHPAQTDVSAANDEYELSFIVERLDMFLSHSWHAPWYLKYACLLFYFNGRPALIAASFVGIIATPLIKSRAASVSIFEKWHVRDWLLSMKDYDDMYPCDLIYSSLFSGVLVFHITLFSWHHFRRLINPRSQSVFLDKVCIHQTDAKLKALGINSIGAVLNNTTTMVIAWDETYFERLWCTFELAAFGCESDGRSTVFLPIMLGTVTLAYTLLVQCMIIIQVLAFKIAAHVFNARADWAMFYKIGYVTVELPLAIIFVHFSRANGRAHIIMKEQIGSFSQHNAQCYCCKNNHINPSTGATIPCDRKLVYQTLAHWYGRGDVKIGVERFDKKVRHELGDAISTMTPGWAKVPFEWAVCCAFGAILRDCDELYYETFYEALHWILFDLLDYVAIFGYYLTMGNVFPASDLSASLPSMGEGVGTVVIASAPSLIHWAYWYLEPPDSEHNFLHWPLALFNLILSIAFFSDCSVLTYLASQQEREVEGEKEETLSVTSATSSRPEAPLPQAPEPSRRLSVRSNFSRRQSH